MRLSNLSSLIIYIEWEPLREIHIIMQHSRILTALLEDRASAFLAKLGRLITTTLFRDIPKLALESIGVILAE